MTQGYDIIVIGGGHAGAEAAWAASNLLLDAYHTSHARQGRVVLVTMDPAKTGAMSCNPAIGGLAKGQMVREIDALGGLMGLATDATGIQFRMLNASKGPAVHGPRAQCDKYRYARQVQYLLSTRPNLTILAGTVEQLLTDSTRITGAIVKPWHQGKPLDDAPLIPLTARAVVLTTGTFMRGLMHTGERQTQGGRIGEGAAVGISAALLQLGLKLGRLKTGTPPRLAAESIDFASLDLQPGDPQPVPFSDLTRCALLEHSHQCPPSNSLPQASDVADWLSPIAQRFPVLEQKPCWITHTSEPIHQRIRDNLHRAPMYNGQIETTGPRYCPSIEDKVVRFADRSSHHVYLEPESLDTNEIYCNGISTSLPPDVQDFIVHQMPGCERAVILKYGYAVEYDMVWPHQIDATAMTKRIAGLFLAGQINGTSGYEEAAGQGLIAGLNAVRFLHHQPLIRLRRDQAYLGVMMDDLVTKTPREPYRMFTSRAEHRLLLRGDNADERLTELGRELGLVDDIRWRLYQARQADIQRLKQKLLTLKIEGLRLHDLARRPTTDAPALRDFLHRAGDDQAASWDARLLSRVLADLQYAGYIEREKRESMKLSEYESAPIKPSFDYTSITGLSTEARQSLSKFQPATFGQAGRLAGVTPADLMLLTMAMNKR